jgi:hypothetical protein
VTLPGGEDDVPVRPGGVGGGGGEEPVRETGSSILHNIILMPS